jgi:hypothetical protein
LATVASQSEGGREGRKERRKEGKENLIIQWAAQEVGGINIRGRYV